jgi:hypothetical protein
MDFEKYSNIKLHENPTVGANIFHADGDKQTDRYDEISLEAFAITEFNEIFLGGEPRQDVKVFQHFGN